MDHLKESKGCAAEAEYKWQSGDNYHAGGVQSQLATAHALIALVERLDKLTSEEKVLGSLISRLRIDTRT